MSTTSGGPLGAVIFAGDRSNSPRADFAGGGSVGRDVGMQLAALRGVVTQLTQSFVPGNKEVQTPRLIGDQIAHIFEANRDISLDAALKNNQFFAGIAAAAERTPSTPVRAPTHGVELKNGVVVTPAKPEVTSVATGGFAQTQPTTTTPHAGNAKVKRQPGPGSTFSV